MTPLGTAIEQRVITPFVVQPAQQLALSKPVLVRPTRLEPILTYHHVVPISGQFQPQRSIAGHKPVELRRTLFVLLCLRLGLVAQVLCAA